MGQTFVSSEPTPKPLNTEASDWGQTFGFAGNARKDGSTEEWDRISTRRSLDR